MSYDCNAILKENAKSDYTLGEIFCVVPELYKYIGIEKLKFTARVYSAIMRGGHDITVRTVTDLLDLTLDDLSRIRGLGKSAMLEILEKIGIYLEKHKPERPDEYVEDTDAVLFSKGKNGNDIIDNQIILANNIKEFRRSKQLSQSEFANICGMTLPILLSIENGISNPKLSTLQGIANYAGCTVSALFEKDGKDNDTISD